MDVFSAVDSFFTTIDSLALANPSETVSNEQQDYPVEFDGGNGGSAGQCVVA